MVKKCCAKSQRESGESKVSKLSSFVFSRVSFQRNQNSIEGLAYTICILYYIVICVALGLRQSLEALDQCSQSASREQTFPSVRTVRMTKPQEPNEKVWKSHILRENFRAMRPVMKLADLAQTEKCLGAGPCILGPMQHKSSFTVIA